MVNFAFQDVEHPYPHNTLTQADFKDKGWPLAIRPRPTREQLAPGPVFTDVGYFSFFSLDYEAAHSSPNIASREPPLKILPDSFDVCSLPYWFRKNGLETNIVKLDEILKTDENFVYYFTLVAHQRVKWFEHVNFNSILLTKRKKDDNKCYGLKVKNHHHFISVPKKSCEKNWAYNPILKYEFKNFDI